MLLDGGRTAPSGIEERDARRDELVEVFVAGHDHDLQAAAAPGGRERADHVVRLEAVDPHHAHAEGVEDLRDALDRAVEVLLQLGAELLPRRLVLGVGPVPERLSDVVHPREIIGTPPLEQAQQKVGDAPRGRGVLAAARGQRARDHREEGAVDEGVTVDQIERRHGPNNNAPGRLRRIKNPARRARGRGVTPNGVGAD